MNAPADAHPDLQGLVDAISSNTAKDGLQLQLQAEQWAVLANYLQPQTLPQGGVLFREGAMDRTLFFLASGNLSVHYEDAGHHIRLAIVGAGSVVGEGGFFTGAPRSATVQAGTPCRLWGLSAIRYSELSNRRPDLALAVAMAAGAVVAKRLVHSRQHVAVT